MNYLKEIYRHYGTSSLYQNPIKIQNRINKPHGAFWGSTTGLPDSWDTWCKEENFNVKNLKFYLDFKIKDTAKVLIIDSPDKYDELYNKYPDDQPILKFLDWVRISRDYDLVIVDFRKAYNPEAMQLYGWDCFSVAVFNLDAIEVYKGHK